MSILNKLRPKGGFSKLFHASLNVILPFILFILVRIDFSGIALALILLSKWRMFAVRPRYWLANLRANGVDIIVALSLLLFMTLTGSYLLQLVWVAIYVLWLLVIKPNSSSLAVSIQALIGQFLGLTALFLWLSGAPLYQLIIGAWIICYLAARHFFTVFEEPFSSSYSHTWGYFAAAITWLLGHWLLFYGSLAQPTLILSIISVGIGSLYYLHQSDRLNRVLRRQILLIMVTALIVILVFSNWSAKIV